MSHLHFIRASAGTGKTERLSELVLEALAPQESSSSRQAVPMEGLVAVTFTTKAASELRSRLRQKLARQGRYNEAQQLQQAYVGTVHAVCKRLLDEFSISAGLPPALDVLPETLSKRAVAEALEQALTFDELSQIEPIADRLRPHVQRYGGHDWLRDANSVIELARSNRIRPEQLPAMAGRAFDAYFPLVCVGSITAETSAIDGRLQQALDAAISRLGDGDGTKKTDVVIRELRQYQRMLTRDSDIAWSEWKKLSEITAAKTSDDYLIGLRNAAAEHCHHPRFRDDLRDYTQLIYRAAASGLANYATWKEERRYLDYTDMEELTLDLLENSEVRESLAARLQLLVVDEFQDTSPIQLALFTKLAELTERAVWVGDRKQSIYSFRGADPELMDAVIAVNGPAGNPSDTLVTSYRSRAALVDFASELFSKGLACDGHREDEVRIYAHRKPDEDGIEVLPPLGLWALEAKNQDDETASLAEGIRRLLAHPEQTPVLDRTSGEVRPLRASDVAVLTVSNDEATGLAGALGTRGIPAIVPRAGLLATPVGTLLHVALRLVVDPGDRAARAVVSALQGFDGQNPDQWLTQLIESHRARRAAREAGQKPNKQVELDPLAKFTQFSPAECVDALVAQFNLPALATRWPQPEAARANLEAFRALAATYEEECRAERRGGSLVGFLRFLDDAAEAENDGQHAGGTDTVEIATYYRAKGLEWPVVILWSLDYKPKGFGPLPTAESQRLEGGGVSSHFQPVLESDGGTFDANAPLKGRWIRFFPWPYGGAKTGNLVDTVAQTPMGQARIAASAREARRLLYVGITRARDHLIFALKAKAPTKASGGVTPTLQTAWLESLHDGKNPIIVLPVVPKNDSATDAISIRGSNVPSTPARVWRLGPGADPPERLKQVTSRRWFIEGAHIEKPSFYIAPSRAELDWPEVGCGQWDVNVHELGGRLPLLLNGTQMVDAGNAIHAFFAADPIEAPAAKRLAVAQRLLEAQGLTGLTHAEDLIAAHDRLRSFVDRIIPGGTWRREIPIVGSVHSAAGRRQVRGSIDLLVEAPTQRLVIDHKSFPGGREQSIERAKSYAPQLASYSKLLDLADTFTSQLFIHMPVAGLAVALTPTSNGG